MHAPPRPLPLLLFIVCAVLPFALGGCDDASPSDADGSDTLPSDTMLSCGAGLLACDGACIDPSSDAAHCGACGTACVAPEACIEGSCSRCPAGQSACDGRCTSLDGDRANCGGCGLSCPAGEVCSGGLCAASCQVGLRNCAGICVNLNTDRANCGACGVQCADGMVCSLGVCTTSCQSQLTECDGLCVNLETDRQHCGGCGAGCAPGELCGGGECVVSCVSDLTQCGSSCAPIERDPLNCGACGVVCDNDERCADGACCGLGASACPSGCANLQEDVDNCGACGVVCAQAEFCVDGGCTLTCPLGQVPCGRFCRFPEEALVCGGTCINPLEDEAHCGSCDNACLGHETCDEGQCEARCPIGQLVCDGVCIDPNTTQAHCGGCDRPCNENQRCSGGQCQSTTGCGDGVCDAATECSACPGDCTASQCTSGDTDTDTTSDTSSDTDTGTDTISDTGDDTDTGCLLDGEMYGSAFECCNDDPDFDGLCGWTSGCDNDGTCDPGEDVMTCTGSNDCFCGDTVCDAYESTAAWCTMDCLCRGDGEMYGDASECCNDDPDFDGLCGWTGACNNDGTCDPGEDSMTCVGTNDCYCGDGTCDAYESSGAPCVVDCGCLSDGQSWSVDASECCNGDPDLDGLCGWMPGSCVDDGICDVGEDPACADCMGGTCEDFLCMDGTCISWTLVCNAVPNCPDGSDEPPFYPCTTTCNGNQICDPGEDMVTCPSDCP